MILEYASFIAQFASIFAMKITAFEPLGENAIFDILAMGWQIVLKASRRLSAARKS